MDTSYRRLLEDYLADRLRWTRGVAADDVLIARIIQAAGDRFVYVSFLADRCEALGRTRLEEELGKVSAGDRVGPALYALWLDGLTRDYGRKEADRVRQVLCMLAAAEQAHGWVFGDGLRPDPVGGAALTMLGEAFAGTSKHPPQHPALKSSPFGGGVSPQG